MDETFSATLETVSIVLYDTMICIENSWLLKFELPEKPR